MGRAKAREHDIGAKIKTSIACTETVKNRLRKR